MTTSSTLRIWNLASTFLALFVPFSAIAQAPLDPPVKPTVTGKFTGNGKAAAIKFVTVLEREPFSDKEAITILFSEKDPATAKKPTFDAMFGKLGNALTLSVHHDGGIFGCEVSHSAHEKRGFSSIGSIKLVDFKLAGGNVSGRATTGKEVDAFGEKWEVDLTFAAPLPEKLRNAPASKPKPATVEADASANEDAPKPASKVPAGPLIAVGKLPLAKDATDVDFKATVEQIHFASPRKVDAVARELSAALKQAGWKDGAGSVMGKTNAILKREQGAAKLTIMVQPAPAGCTVKIFTEGLDWSEAPAPASAKKATGVPSVKDIEAEAEKAIKDALKGL